MTITRDQIVATARGYKGTPYLHQGRVKGAGIDCVGLGVCVSWDLGIKPRSWNITGYRRLPDGHSLMRHLRENMAAEIGQGEMQTGDMVVVAFDEWPHHVGIVADYMAMGSGGLQQAHSVIHANSKTGRVEEGRLVFDGAMRFVAAFQFPGVA